MTPTDFTSLSSDAQADWLASATSEAVKALRMADNGPSGRALVDASKELRRRAQRALNDLRQGLTPDGAS